MSSPEVRGPAPDLTRIRLKRAIYFCLHEGSLPENTAERQPRFTAENSRPKNSDKLCATKICSVWDPIHPVDFVCPATTQSVHNGFNRRTNTVLNPFNRCEPGRCAVFVESGLKSVGFDGSDIPFIAEVERRSQLIPTDWMRANIGTGVTKA